MVRGESEIDEAVSPRVVLRERHGLVCCENQVAILCINKPIFTGGLQADFPIG